MVAWLGVLLPASVIDVVPVLATMSPGVRTLDASEAAGAFCNAAGTVRSTLLTGKKVAVPPGTSVRAW